MLLAFYIVQANPGTTTCSQPPNSTTVGMNDITLPRIEDEEQEVIKMQHVNIPNACPFNTPNELLEYAPKVMSIQIGLLQRVVL